MQVPLFPREIRTKQCLRDSDMRNLNLRTLLFVVVIAAAVSPAAHSQSRPYRGGIPWSFLLCKFSDSPTPPHDLNYYKQMTIQTGTNGLADYVHSVSNGAADLGGSSVHGWYTEAHTTAYEQGLSSRYQRLQDCLDTAKADHSDPYAPPSGQRVYVITSPGVDLVGFENCCSVGGDTVALPEIAHEFGHGIDLEHSFSNDSNYHNACWAQPGEYDNPWDLMSAANVFVDPTHDWGGGPPFLDAYHQDEMGWIPQSRILTLGLNGILAATVTLAPLSHQETSGYLVARVPFDNNDLFHYYTVEYRTADSWDKGIPADIVLINEVKLNTKDNLYQTFLQRAAGSGAGCPSCTPAVGPTCTYGNGAPLESVNANGVKISVQGTPGQTATISISTDWAMTCLQGYVWRSSSSIDRVCVKPASRTQAGDDNSKAGSRHVPNSDTCIQGYVWREATPGDHVCVTPAVRAQTQNENAQAYDNADPTRGVYGPNTCSSPYVWRIADDLDYVCVTTSTRAQTLADNAAAGSRHVHGSDTCVQGYVWREAYPGDHVCVTTSTRSQAKSDNSQADSRIVKPNL
jgi:hypothetical protein